MLMNGLTVPIIQIAELLAYNYSTRIFCGGLGGDVSRVGQWVRMAMEYKIVIPPDMGGTRPCIECPPCQVI